MPQEVTKSAEEFSGRLRELRKKSGMSQKEFAEKLGMHQVQYGRYERGDSIPYAESLTKIADALNVSVDYLLEGETTNAVIANLEDEELLKLFAEVGKFSQSDKEHVKAVIRAFVKQAKLQQLAS